MRALEIGPGLNPVNHQWTIMDMVKNPGVDIIHDIRKRPWPLPDSKYDLIYMSHILEHVPWFDTVATLKEAWRLLAPNGIIEIWVPDFAKIVQAYLDNKCGDTWRKFNPNGDVMTWVNGRIFTYGPNDENWHRAVFDAVSLSRQLLEAGFRKTMHLKKPRGYDHGKINLGVGAVK